MNTNMNIRSHSAGSRLGPKARLSVPLLALVTVVATLFSSSLPALAQVPPTFTTQPSSAIVPLGGSVLMRVSATGTAVTLLWRFNGVPITSATNPTFAITNVTRASAGAYTVVARGSSGQLISAPATLTVVAPPAITVQPTATVNVTSGNNYTYSVTAVGDDPTLFPNTYQWWVNGAQIAGATNSTYTIKNATSLDNGTYQVTVENAVGSVTSATSTFTAYVAPTIAVQPVNQTNAAGLNVAFVVVAGGTPPFTFQWRFGANKTILSGAGVTTGQFTNTLALNNISFAQAAPYDVVVSNPGGTVTSSVASLVVTTPALPTVTTQPATNVTVAVGDRFSLSLAAAGTASSAFTYQWRFNGFSLANGVFGGTGVFGATSNTLTLTNVTLSQAGTYDALVISPYGTTNTATTTVTVIVPTPITVSDTSLPQDVTSFEGGTVSLTSAVSGNPLSLQWYNISGLKTALAGQTGPTLVLSNITASTAGKYVYIATNILGAVTSRTAVVTVELKPRITTQPAGRSLASGQSLALNVVATGTGPLTYQWYFNGLIGIVGANSSSLLLTNTTPGISGDYTVVVSNAGGSVTSAAAHVTIVDGVAITSQPVSQTVTNGVNVMLSVGATGGSLNYQWTYNGGNFNSFDIPGAVGPTLVLTNVTPANTGDYTVRVFNNVSQVVSSAAHLNVEIAPAITVQPQSQTAPIGSTVTLSVTATGSPLNYKWQFNGTAIGGATSSTLVITNVTSAFNAAKFSVVVTNDFGSVTSANAVLTVVPATPPTIVSQPVGVTVLSGGTATFSVVASGSAVLNYQWNYNGTPFAGATGPSLVLVGVTSANAGNYTVTVSNGGGTVTSAPAPLSIASASVAGQWDFTGRNLAATVGSAMQYLGNTASLTTFTNVTINGQSATVMAFPAAATTNIGYVVPHGISPNGGGTKVNQYTLIMDLYMPAFDPASGFQSLWQTDTSNNSDGDLYIRSPDGGIGISGKYDGAFTLNAWHRLAFTFDLTSSNLVKYIDGNLVGQQTLSAGVDGRWSLAPTAILFGDSDHESAPGWLSSVQVDNVALTASQIKALGGVSASKIPVSIPSPSEASSLAVPSETQ